MTRAELPSQSISNGEGGYHDVSLRDRKFFANKVTRAPAPDIDSAMIILADVQRSYGALGVPSKDRKKIARELEEKLYGGNASEQTRASQTIQSMGQIHGSLTEAFPR